MTANFENGFTCPSFVGHTRTERLRATEQPTPTPPQEGGKKLRKQAFLSPPLVGVLGGGC